jgi:molybdenum cofactor cytidylyltransferase
MRVGALILAAGTASRFGAPKVLAGFEGRPILAHVLETARVAGLDPRFVVLGHEAAAAEREIAWAGEQRFRNPRPEDGLASSLRIGLEAILAADPPVDRVIVLLGDQPLTRPDVVRMLAGADPDPAHPIVMPRYAGGGGPHPVLVDRPAFPLLAEATGDRGLGPIAARHPELVKEVPVDGLNPDVDTRADLAALLEATWNRRVVENREQVDRFRELPDGPDFYAPVSAMFRVDPDRQDDPHLAALAALVQPGETVLDIGCGAGRFALPLARRAGALIGVDPSSSMLEALREDASHHGILNVRAVAGRWPAAFAELSPSGEPIADLAFIAHVGYDVEPIGPFLEAMASATRRRCAALLTEPAPASLADPFWPAVHGESRVALPAAELLLELPPRGYASHEELHRFLRHQLWVEPDGEKDRRLTEAIRRLAERRGERWYIREETPGRLALITWEPRPGA